MNKEQILAGLKNAIERGYSLELAKQSFINAGYNPRDVEEAANELSGVISSYPQMQQEKENEKETALDESTIQGIPKPSYSQYSYPTQKPIQPIQPKPLSQVSQFQQFRQAQSQPKNHKKLVILLVIILSLLAAALITTFVFKEQILDFIMSFFSEKA